MKWLVCGGRHFHDRSFLRAFLDELLCEEGRPLTHLIHGASWGADALADDWAITNRIQPVRCPALWTVFGNGAGPIRNRAMLALVPDLVIAFPGGKGTEDMWSLAAAVRRIRAVKTE